MSKKYEIEEYAEKRHRYVIRYLIDMPWAYAGIVKDSSAYIASPRSFSQLGTCWESYGDANDRDTVFGDSHGFSCGKYIGKRACIYSWVEFPSKLARFVRS